MEELGPVRFRPRATRVAVAVAAVVIVVAAVVLSTALTGRIGPGPAVFGTADRVATIGLGVIVAAAVLTLARPVVEADDERIRVVNVIGGCEVPWSLVREIRFDRGASWASLELVDGDEIGVLAVQAVDKQHAVEAVRALRARHAAHRQRAGGGSG